MPVGSVAIRRLIVNADDFGLTSGVNRAVLEAHTHGIVTSSTLMACGAKFEEAAEMAARSPKLSVGCHVLLVDASPLLEWRQIPTLASNHSGGARFPESVLTFAGRALARRLDAEEIEAEITAQIRRLQAAGIQVSHLDSHKHTHMFPVVFRAMLRAARSSGVRAMRNPFDSLVLAGTRYWKRRFQFGVLGAYQASFRRALLGAGMVTPDGSIGMVATGGLNRETFPRLIGSLPPGTWELVTHPGYNDGELDRVKTRLRGSREAELALLTSVAAKELLAREGIELISYADFTRPSDTAPKVQSPSSFPE